MATETTSQEEHPRFHPMGQGEAVELMEAIRPVLGDGAAQSTLRVEREAPRARAWVVRMMASDPNPEIPSAELRTFYGWQDFAESPWYDPQAPLKREVWMEARIAEREEERFARKLSEVTYGLQRLIQKIESEAERLARDPSLVDPAAMASHIAHEVQWAIPNLGLEYVIAQGYATRDARKYSKQAAEALAIDSAARAAGLVK